MFYLVDMHGQSIGRYEAREAAVAAMDALLDADADSQVAVIEIDAAGNRVGSPITRVHA